jgi:FkbM family methyltransferase
MRLLFERVYSFFNSIDFLKPILLNAKDAFHRRYKNSGKHSFYSQFIKKNDLCFDVGANVGNRVDVFLDLGCTVVAIEPQKACLAHLKKKYAGQSRVVLVEKALDAQEGVNDLFICNADAISSMSKEWINTVKKDRYKHFKWNDVEKVETTTLDALIALYGLPALCKIDVEGYEINVLKGLSHRIPCISFEYSPERLGPAKDCINHLANLGQAVFNYSIGETMQLVLKEWVPANNMLDIIDSLKEAHSGDIYVKFGN